MKRRGTLGRGEYKEKAYRKIKEYILNSDFYPGQHIRHVEVSKVLSMSRTPAREAMQRLVEEGLVKHVPNRGYFVSEITEKEAEELYELREILETFCIERAIDRCTEREIQNIHNLLEKYKAVIDGHVSRQTLLVDRNFHLKIAELSGNDLVYKVLFGVFEKIIMKRNIERIPVSDAKDGLKRHIAILQAIENQDREEAVSQIKEHIREGRRRVLEQISRRKDFRVRSGKPRGASRKAFPSSRIPAEQTFPLETSSGRLNAGDEEPQP